MVQWVKVPGALPEFDLQDPCGGRKDPSPASSSLTYMGTPSHEKAPLQDM